MIIQILIMFVVGLIISSVSVSLTRTRVLGLSDRTLAGLTGSFIGGLLSFSGIIKSVLGVNIGGIFGTIIWAALGAMIALLIISQIKSKPLRDD